MNGNGSQAEIIRSAQHQDADALVDIYIECFQERVNEVFGGAQRRTMIRDYLLFYLSWDPANNWVVTRGEEIMGFVIAPCRYSPLRSTLKHGQLWRWLGHLLTGRYGLPLHLVQLFLRSGFAFSPAPALQRLNAKPMIHLCAIRSSCQGRGVGSRLMAHTMAMYRRQGVSCCWLLVQQDNLPALALYKKFGFEVDDAVSPREIVMVWGTLKRAVGNDGRSDVTAH